VRSLSNEKRQATGWHNHHHHQMTDIEMYQTLQHPLNLTQIYLKISRSHNSSWFLSSTFSFFLYLYLFVCRYFSSISNQLPDAGKSLISMTYLIHIIRSYYLRSFGPILAVEIESSQRDFHSLTTAAYCDTNNG